MSQFAPLLPAPSTTDRPFAMDKNAAAGDYCFWKEEKRQQEAEWTVRETRTMTVSGKTTEQSLGANQYDDCWMLHTQLYAISLMVPVGGGRDRQETHKYSDAGLTEYAASLIAGMGKIESDQGSPLKSVRT